MALYAPFRIYDNENRTLRRAQCYTEHLGYFLLGNEKGKQPSIISYLCILIVFVFIVYSIVPLFYYCYVYTTFHFSIF